MNGEYQILAILAARHIALLEQEVENLKKALAESRKEVKGGKVRSIKQP